MSTRPSFSRPLAALLVLAAVGTVAAPRLVPAQAAAFTLVKTAPAQVLVNAHGMTLYVFTVDKPGAIACTGKCTTVWRPLLVPKGMPVETTGGPIFATERAGGALQLTYFGAPLYTFVEDKKPGDRKGLGLGGHWWTVVVGMGSSSSATGSSLLKTAPAQMLVNARGLPLYVFGHDKPGAIACTGKCAAFWPPLLVPRGMTLPSTVSGISGTFHPVMRPGGTHQCSYDSAPLYTFAEDKKPGDMKGVGIASAWWIAAA